jgi:hypothetical protein
VLVPPSPNVHAQLVGVFVELSVNVTLSGSVPVRGVPVKFATGTTTGGAPTSQTQNWGLDPVPGVVVYGFGAPDANVAPVCISLETDAAET